MDSKESLMVAIGLVTPQSHISQKLRKQATPIWVDCNNWVTTQADVKETTFSQMPMTAIIQFNAKVTINTHRC